MIDLATNFKDPKSCAENKKYQNAIAMELESRRKFHARIGDLNGALSLQLYQEVRVESKPIYGVAEEWGLSVRDVNRALIILGEV